jgi:uncharacterized membrane protein
MNGVSMRGLATMRAARDRASTPDPVFTASTPGDAGARRGRSRATWTSAALLALVAVLVVLAAPSRAQSRSQSYGAVAIDAELRPDGSLHVVEEREINYSGSWNGEVYQLPLDDGQQVTLTSLTDDRGTTYREGACSPDGDRQPGAYQLLGDDEQFEVAWCWDPPPTDTTRTMTLDYTVTDAGTRHADASQLYWKWVGTGWDAPTARVTADVTLPVQQDLQFWAHGPLTGTVEQVEPGVIRTAVDDLPPSTFVELRVLMPPDALPGAPSDGEDVREAVLAEERCLALAADADRARARGEEPAEDCDPDAGRKQLVTGALGGVVLGGGLGWWQLFRRHGREHPLPPDIADREYEHQPPSDDPPAHVDYLVNWGNISEQALIATIMDLARRRHLILRRELVTRERFLRGDVDEPVMIMERGSDPPRSWERDVIDLLFEWTDSDGRTITDAELKSWVSANREDAYRWWQSWTSAVAADTAGQRWIEQKHWAGVSAVLGALLLGVGVGAAFLGANLVLAIVAGVAGIAMAAASPLMRRRTSEGHILEHRWRRFGAYLADYSLIPERGPEYLALWGEWLVYAIPLGVAETVTRNLNAKLSEAQLEEVGGGWYPMLWYHGHLYGGFDAGLSSITAAIPTSQIAASPASSTGAGGGFAGGGGGGGGGSGGGGF